MTKRRRLPSPSAVDVPEVKGVSSIEKNGPRRLGRSKAARGFKKQHKEAEQHTKTEKTARNNNSSKQQQIAQTAAQRAPQDQHKHENGSVQTFWKVKSCKGGFCNTAPSSQQQQHNRSTNSSKNSMLTPLCEFGSVCCKMLRTWETGVAVGHC